MTPQRHRTSLGRPGSARRTCSRLPRPRTSSNPAAATLAQALARVQADGHRTEKALTEAEHRLDAAWFFTTNGDGERGAELDQQRKALVDQMDRLLKPADVDRLAQLADEQGLTALTSAEQGQLAAERPDEFHLAFERGLAA